jgi:hypothetical protein
LKVPFKTPQKNGFYSPVPKINFSMLNSHQFHLTTRQQLASIRRQLWLVPKLFVIRQNQSFDYQCFTKKVIQNTTSGNIKTVKHPEQLRPVGMFYQMS